MRWVLSVSAVLACAAVEAGAEPGSPLPLGMVAAESDPEGLAEVASIDRRAEQALGEVGPGVWLPYPTEDPFIWSADACLGYLWTRDPAALGDGVAITRDEGRLEVELGRMRGRIQIQDGAAEGGGFRCATMRWPEMPPDTDRLGALGRWVEHRLLRRDGWRGAFEPDNPEGLRLREVASFRHEGLGVTLNVQARFDYHTGSDYLFFGLEADGSQPSEVPAG